MSKHSGARCRAGGGCADDPLFWCELIDGQCTDGGQGDPGMEQMMQLPIAEFRKAIEASPSRFRLDRKGNFIEVGVFADATVQVGDKLIGIVEVCEARIGGKSLEIAEGPDTRLYESTEGQLTILKWQFTAPELAVIFERNGVSYSKVIKNSKAKQ